MRFLFEAADFLPHPQKKNTKHLGPKTESISEDFHTWLAKDFLVFFLLIDLSLSPPEVLSFIVSFSSKIPPLSLWLQGFIRLRGFMISLRPSVLEVNTSEDDTATIRWAWSQAFLNLRSQKGSGEMAILPRVVQHKRHRDGGVASSTNVWSTVMQPKGHFSFQKNLSNK